MLENHRDLLKRYGYDELYEAWLAAATGKYNETELRGHVQELMQRTAATANWGETIELH